MFNPKYWLTGALCGRLFGFLLGSTLAGASVYYYILEEYKVSNDMLTEDIYVSEELPQLFWDYPSQCGPPVSSFGLFKRRVAGSFREETPMPPKSIPFHSLQRPATPDAFNYLAHLLTISGPPSGRTKNPRIRLRDGEQGGSAGEKEMIITQKN